MSTFLGIITTSLSQDVGNVDISWDYYYQFESRCWKCWHFLGLLLPVWVKMLEILTFLGIITASLSQDVGNVDISWDYYYQFESRCWKCWHFLGLLLPVWVKMLEILTFLGIITANLSQDVGNVNIFRDYYCQFESRCWKKKSAAEAKLRKLQKLIWS